MLVVLHAPRHLDDRDLADGGTRGTLIVFEASFCKWPWLDRAVETDALTMLFCNIGWMKKYRGTSRDSISGGGSWIKESGLGTEVYNFQPHRGFLYGSFQTPRGGKLSIERLGAQASAESVEAVTVAWVAKHPAGGLRLVGWYRSARVYRDYQAAPGTSGRWLGDQRAGYLAVAREADGVVLPPEERTLRIPRNKRGAMGQSNVWFADSAAGRATIAEVRRFIRDWDRRSRGAASVARISNVERRVDVERAAIRQAAATFQNYGYRVTSVESDNVGWDLEAVRDTERLQVEVKGLSHAGGVVELTPNEFEKMRKLRKTYRLCVVQFALTPRRRVVRIFSCLGDGKTWTDDDDRQLSVEPRTGARVRWA